MGQTLFKVGKGLAIDDTLNSNGVTSVIVYAGSPEGAVSAAVATMCIDTSGGQVYIKNSGAGNTGWKKLAIENFLDIKESCILATYNDTNWSTTATSNFVTSTALLTISNLDAGASLGKLDGIECVVGNRILLKDMATISAYTRDGGADTNAGKYNGIWVVQAAGGSTTSIALKRATDADEDAEVTSGMFTFIEKGTVNVSTGWILNTVDPIVVGTTVLVFAQFTAAGSYIAGNGISISGQTISAKLDAAGGLEDNSSSTRINVDSTTDTTLINGSNELAVKGMKRIHLTSAPAPSGMILDSLAITDVSAVDWMVMIKNGTTGRYMSRVSAVCLGTGTTVDSDEYSIKAVGVALSSPTLSVDVNSGNLRLILDCGTAGLTIEVTRIALDNL